MAQLTLRVLYLSTKKFLEEKKTFVSDAKICVNPPHLDSVYANLGVNYNVKSFVRLTSNLFQIE